LTKNSKLGFKETLANVVLSEKCTGCAACVVTCPFNCLRYVKGKPEITGECKACGICPKTCPQYNSSRPLLEKFVFGREKKPQEEFGIYRRVLVARSTDKNTLKVCQDGGVVTTLLTSALINKTINGAAVSAVNRDKPLYPKPIFATTKEQILQSAGTKYFHSPNLLALQKSLEQNKRKLAIVGTPCQIEAIRKIQTIPLKNYIQKLKLTIGLICSGSFSYEGLIEDYIKGKLNINPSDITKINIKSKVLLTTKSGETKNIPLKKIQQYTRTSCHTCKDFSAELADISVGGLGLNGWSLVIIRTKTTEKLFTDTVKAGLLEVKSIKEEKRSLDLLIKLSKKQRMKRKNF